MGFQAITMDVRTAAGEAAGGQQEASGGETGIFGNHIILAEGGGIIPMARSPLFAMGAQPPRTEGFQVISR